MIAELPKATTLAELEALLPWNVRLVASADAYSPQIFCRDHVATNEYSWCSPPSMAVARTELKSPR